MTKKCTGPWGLMSRNAIHLSSSKMIFAGICFVTNLSKKVGAAGLIAGSVDFAIAEASTSLIILKNEEEEY